MDNLYNFENARDIICGECCVIQEDGSYCNNCPVELTYRELLDEKLGTDFPTPYTVHAVDSGPYLRDKEKWLARRHRKGDIKAKRQKVKVRKKDTGYLKDNRCTTRRKEALIKN